MAHHYPEADEPESAEELWCIIVIKKDGQMCFGTIDATISGGGIVNRFRDETIADLVVVLLGKLIECRSIQTVKIEGGAS